MQSLDNTIHEEDNAMKTKMSKQQGVVDLMLLGALIALLGTSTVLYFDPTAERLDQVAGATTEASETGK